MLYTVKNALLIVLGATLLDLKANSSIEERKSEKKKEQLLLEIDE